MTLTGASSFKPAVHCHKALDTGAQARPAAAGYIYEAKIVRRTCKTQWKVVTRGIKCSFKTTHPQNVKKKVSGEMPDNYESDFESQLLRAKCSNMTHPPPPPCVLTGQGKGLRQIKSNLEKSAQAKSQESHKQDQKAFIHPCDGPCVDHMLVDQWDVTYWLMCITLNPSVG